MSHSRDPAATQRLAKGIALLRKRKYGDAIGILQEFIEEVKQGADAKAADADLQFALASFYREGRGVTRNYVAAMSYYNKALELKQADAKFYRDSLTQQISASVREGYYLQGDQKQIEDYLQHEANGNDSHALDALLLLQHFYRVNRQIQSQLLWCQKGLDLAYLLNDERYKKFAEKLAWFYEIGEDEKGRYRDVRRAVILRRRGNSAFSTGLIPEEDDDQDLKLFRDYHLAMTPACDGAPDAVAKQVLVINPDTFFHLLQLDKTSQFPEFKEQALQRMIAFTPMIQDLIKTSLVPVIRNSLACLFGHERLDEYNKDPKTNAKYFDVAILALASIDDTIFLKDAEKIFLGELILSILRQEALVCRSRALITEGVVGDYYALRKRGLECLSVALWPTPTGVDEKKAVPPPAAPLPARQVVVDNKAVVSLDAEYVDEKKSVPPPDVGAVVALPTPPAVAAPPPALETHDLVEEKEKLLKHQELFVFSLFPASEKEFKDLLGDAKKTYDDEIKRLAQASEDLTIVGWREFSKLIRDNETLKKFEYDFLMGPEEGRVQKIFDILPDLKDPHEKALERVMNNLPFLPDYHEAKKQFDAKRGSEALPNLKRLVSGPDVAHQADIPEVDYMLSVLYAGNHGVAKDEKAALRHLQTAADKNHAEAQWNLANVHRENKREDLASSYERKAADNGHAAAQLKVANAYLETRRFAQAKIYYTRVVLNRKFPELAALADKKLRLLAGIALVEECRLPMRLPPKGMKSKEAKQFEISELQLKHKKRDEAYRMLLFLKEEKLARHYLAEMTAGVERAKHYKKAGEFKEMEVSLRQVENKLKLALHDNMIHRRERNIFLPEYRREVFELNDFYYQSFKKSKNINDFKRMFQVISLFPTDSLHDLEESQQSIVARECREVMDGLLGKDPRMRDHAMIAARALIRNGRISTCADLYDKVNLLKFSPDAKITPELNQLRMRRQALDQYRWQELTVNILARSLKNLHPLEEKVLDVVAEHRLSFEMATTVEEEKRAIKLMHTFLCDTIKVAKTITSADAKLHGSKPPKVAWLEKLEKIAAGILLQVANKEMLQHRHRAR